MPRPCKIAALMCLALVFVVSVLPFPASAAAVVYDPADYFDGFTISGDTKTATYVFDGVMPLHKLVVDGVDKGNNVSGGFSLMVNNASEIRISSYLTGVVAWADKPLPGGGIKISDIMPGAELTFSTKFHFGYTLEGDATVIDEAVLFTQWAFYAYDSNGNYLGKYLQDSEEKTWVPTGSNGIVVDSTATYTVGANTAYILPFALSRFNIPAGYGANLLGFFDPFTITADINMIYENSQTMTAIKDKLTDIDNSIGQTNDKLDGIGDSLDQTNDKLDEILTQPEQEKQEASTDGDSNVNELVGAIPNESQGFIDAISTLAAAMSYSGNEAKLSTPAIVMPTIPGVWDSFVLLEPQTIDFGYWIQQFPEAPLTIVRVLSTIALIGYCFKELYSAVSYAMTLKGGTS